MISYLTLLQIPYKIFRCNGSYKDSLGLIKNKKAAITSINKKHKCFQYAAVVALNYGKLEKIV